MITNLRIELFEALVGELQQTEGSPGGVEDAQDALLLHQHQTVHRAEGPLTQPRSAAQSYANLCCNPTASLQNWCISVHSRNGA